MVAEPNDSDPTGAGSASDREFDEAPARAVVTTLAESTGQSPLEPEPLFETVDPDGLNALFVASGSRDPSVTVSFDYCGHHVTITDDDGIEVSPLGSGE